MKVTYCDICYQVIKPGTKKYVLGIHILTHEGDKQKLEEVIQHNYQYHLPKIEMYEICGECKQVLEHFFHIRKEKLAKIKKELKKIFKKRMDTEGDING